MPTMTAEPALDVRAPSGAARGVALVLHGGRANSRAAVRGTQLAVLRMRPFAAALHRGGAAGGLAVASLRYLVRGWNGADRSPVPDVRWALDRLAQHYPGVPVALVGHSMGGRSAVYAAGHDSVRAVVALAPWLESGDPVQPLADRRVLIAHGDRDRITDPRASARFAAAAARVATSVSYVRVQGDKHAMLHRAALWHTLATGFVLGALFGTVPPGPEADVVRKALAGTPLLAV